MTYRTTQADLDRWSHRLNQVTGSPTERFRHIGNHGGPYIRGGEVISNVGHYYICQGNGGYKLARIGNEGGGDSDVFEHGRRYTKRELVWLISAFVKGFELGRDMTIQKEEPIREWKCSKCGNIFEATIESRIEDGEGCPSCKSNA